MARPCREVTSYGRVWRKGAGKWGLECAQNIIIIHTQSKHICIGGEVGVRVQFPAETDKN